MARGASAVSMTSLLVCCAVVALAAAVVPLPAATAEPFVLHNGTIYTMAPARPYASALCVEDGRIQVVGGEAEVLRSGCAARASAAATRRVVDLRGATVVPGLTDSHAHLMYEAARRLRADLLEAASPAEAARTASDYAKAHPDLVEAGGGWVQGFGWDQTKWPGGAFPMRKDLDGLFPDVPVFLEQLSGHACWVNSKALELLAPDLPASGDPPGGHIERDADGKPTGILSDGAMYLVIKHIKPFTVKEADSALSEVLHDCAMLGLTGVHDMDTLDVDLELFQQRHARGDLTLRIYAAIRGGAGGGSPDDPFITTDDGMLTKRAVKFFADGAIGSWSAAMLEPYDDRPTVNGTLVYKKEELRTNVSTWAKKGYQIATHAIGDAANRQILDIYEEVSASLLAAALAGNSTELRWRVEHAQILSKEDIPRFASLGIIPSMQPSHCASDLGYAEQRLGADRASRSYAWVSLLETGVHALPFGSDFPTAGSIPPLLGLHAAVTRETPDGVPAGGWFPQQRVTREQAIRGYTAHAAYASFRERELGMLQPGFWADLAVFDRDVLTVAAASLLEAKVIGTVVGGHVVYAANASASAPASSTTADDLAELVPAGARNFHHGRSHSRTGGVGGGHRRGFGRGPATVSNWWREYTRDAREDRHAVWRGRAEEVLI